MAAVRVGRVAPLAAATVAAVAACNALVGNDDITFFEPDVAQIDASSDVVIRPEGGDADAGPVDDGGLVVVASEPDGGLGNVAVTPTHVYWAVDPLGQVRRMPKTGGATETFGASPPPVATTDFAVGPDHVFVNGYGGSSAQRLPFAGGAAFLPNGCPGTRLTSGIAFAAPNVYYAVNDCAGAAVPVTLRRASSVDAFGTSTALVEAGAPSGRAVIAADDSDVVLGAESMVVRVSPDLTEVRASAGPYPGGDEGLVVALALEKSSVFIRHPRRVRVLARANLATTAAVDVPNAVFARGQNRAQLAITDGFVYVGAQTGLLRISRSTSTVETLFPGRVLGVAVDATHVYFSVDDTLYRLGL
ncbi:MAG: hypothetical protein JST00_12625 [Deltaproteobacteria bacterium]|nr:hypothetical protein [Deltaproteobacteria bacterium]